MTNCYPSTANDLSILSGLFVLIFVPLNPRGCLHVGVHLTEPDGILSCPLHFHDSLNKSTFVFIVIWISCTTVCFPLDLQICRVSWLKAVSRERQEIYSCHASCIIWLANKVTDFKRPIKRVWVAEQKRMSETLFFSFHQGGCNEDQMTTQESFIWFFSPPLASTTSSTQASLNWKVLPWGANACQFLLLQTTVAIHGSELDGEGGGKSPTRCPGGRWFSGVVFSGHM